MLELLPVCMCRLTAGGGRDAPRERGNMLWGRLRMPPWVAVWGTITNSSSEGVNILAKLRLYEGGTAEIINNIGIQLWLAVWMEFNERYWSSQWGKSFTGSNAITQSWVIARLHDHWICKRFLLCSYYKKANFSHHTYIHTHVHRCTFFLVRWSLKLADCHRRESWTPGRRSQEPRSPAPHEVELWPAEWHWLENTCMCVGISSTRGIQIIEYRLITTLYMYMQGFTKLINSCSHFPMTRADHHKQDVKKETMAKMATQFKDLEFVAKVKDTAVANS